MTVVFFFPKILRDIHKDIFQLEKLEKDGYNIILLDATKYYKNVSTATIEFILKNKYEVKTIGDFFSFKKQLPEGPVIYVSFDQYLKFALPIFNIIIRKNDVLLSYHTKRFSNINQPTGKIRGLADRLIKMLDNSIRLDFLKFYYRYIHRLYIPDYFLCSTNFLIPTKTYFTVKKENRIVVHADDINHTLSPPQSIIDKEKRTAVFLDQGIPFLHHTHPNIYINPLPKDYLEEYYEKLTKTFLQLKEEYNLDEIVIALHPDAVKFKDELNGKFSNFKTFIGVTKDLIRDSDIVLAHCSTAISFAIFYNKPVFILTDKVMMNYDNRLNKAISYFINDLDMKEVELDNNVLKQNIRSIINVEKYSNYRRHFLKDNNIQENSYYYAINKIRNEIQVR